MAFAEPPGWYVISLRPQGEHAPMRRAASSHGARVIAVSPWRLQLREDDEARDALRRALAASRVLFTSPAAVRAASRLQVFQQQPGQHWIAVGSGTGDALARAGIDGVVTPTRMDSEGLLALPCLQDPDGQDVALVTAPQGRDLLANTLRGRGANLLRADVYARVPVMLSANTLNRLRTLDAPVGLALSSGAALERVLTLLPVQLVQQWQAMPVAAASPRLLQAAREAGFSAAQLAEGPRPRQLLAALAPRFR